MEIPRCKLFTGYRPCVAGWVCDADCPHIVPFSETILIVNLDALGDVLRTTSVLPGLRRRYPEALVTWVTLPRHTALFQGIDSVDRVVPFDAESALWIPALEFNVAVNFDKSPRSAGLIAAARAREKRGFGLSAAGAIVPLNAGAEYTYRLGLDDLLKYAENTRTVPDLVCEIAEVEYVREPYRLRLTKQEETLALQTRRSAGAESDDLLIGFNTGASAREPAKQLPFDVQVSLLRSLARACPGAALALLGGPAETEWNERLAAVADVHVYVTPGENDLRRGICHIAACDVVVTGDTAALHLALALGRYVVAWFGPTAHAEIDLFDHGEKILTSVPAGPGWSEAASGAPRFPLDLDRLVEAVARVPGPAERRTL